MFTYIMYRVCKKINWTGIVVGKSLLGWFVVFASSVLIDIGISLIFITGVLGLWKYL